MTRFGFDSPTVIVSHTQVEILVDDGIVGGDGDTDGDALEVEAGTLATVTAAAVLYDTRLSSSNGCDPEGCTADLTRVGKRKERKERRRWQKKVSFPEELTCPYVTAGAQFCAVSEIKSVF